MSRFVQVGVTALRDPKTGDFLPSVPLYIKVDDEEEATAIQEPLFKDIGGVFAKRMKEYVDAHGGLEKFLGEEDVHDTQDF